MEFIKRKFSNKSQKSEELNFKESNLKMPYSKILLLLLLFKSQNVFGICCNEAFTKWNSIKFLKHPHAHISHCEN